MQSKVVPGGFKCVSLCPLASKFKTPANLQGLLDKQMVGPSTEDLTETDFPVQSFNPKVQMPFRRVPGQNARKVEVER